MSENRVPILNELWTGPPNYEYGNHRDCKCTMMRATITVSSVSCVCFCQWPAADTKGRYRGYMRYYLACFSSFILCGWGIFSVSRGREIIMFNSLWWCFMNWYNPLLKWLLFLRFALSCVTEISDTIMYWVKKFFLVFVSNLLPGHVILPR